MSKVLFVSQLPLGRCENLTAVYEAYDGPKEFRCGTEHMGYAEHEGYSVVVCDCLPAYINGKDRVKSVNIGHGITGDKLYAADEKHKPWYDQRAADQIDYAIATSEAGVGIVAGQFRIPRERVLPLGMPRTDAYFRDGKKMNKFLLGYSRVYLYAPTFRNGDGWLPKLDWARIDRLLNGNERVVVKRHYFTREELTRGYDVRNGRVIEVPPDEPSTFYLRSCKALVTDYSSIMFDAYLMGKPSVLLADDMDEYLDKRGMYNSYPHFYGSRWLRRSEGHEELLVEAMREAADEGMTGVERECVEAVAGACDGHSTERVCDLVRSLA